MRIDLINLKNFKKFAKQTFRLHPQFTLLIGDNGSGKTSVLDALSVALGVWLLEVPDSDIQTNSRRPIYPSELRLEPTQTGDRVLFHEAWSGVEVIAQGALAEGKESTWSFEIPMGKRKTSNQGAKSARDIIRSIFKKSESDTPVTLPVLGYYGAGRAWLPHHPRRLGRGDFNRPAKRWAAFYDCLNERIRLADVADWFQVEAIAAVNREGRFRPGFEIVKRAILTCVPGGDGMWYDGDRKQVVLSINKQAQPFSNLSAGQKMMLALAADIAIKMVTQNNYLVPPDVFDMHDEALPRVLAETPGVILIDELDVHLHPRWQRRVASDLKKTFPRVQFVCTSHSPQVIGELLPEEIRLLDEPSLGAAPTSSFGLDSNSVLEDLQHADARNAEVQRVIDDIEAALDDADLQKARHALGRLRDIQRGETRDTVKFKATINNVEALADAED